MGLTFEAWLIISGSPIGWLTAWGAGYCCCCFFSGDSQTNLQLRGLQALKLLQQRPLEDFERKLAGWWRCVLTMCVRNYSSNHHFSNSPTLTRRIISWADFGVLRQLQLYHQRESLRRVDDLDFNRGKSLLFLAWCYACWRQLLWCFTVLHSTTLNADSSLRCTGIQRTEHCADNTVKSHEHGLFIRKKNFTSLQPLSPHLTTTTLEQSSHRELPSFFFRNTLLPITDCDSDSTIPRYVPFVWGYPRRSEPHERYSGTDWARPSGWLVGLATATTERSRRRGVLWNWSEEWRKKTCWGLARLELKTRTDGRWSQVCHQYHSTGARRHGVAKGRFLRDRS